MTPTQTLRPAPPSPAVKPGDRSGRRRRPVLLAIAGDSAAGKTTIAEGIMAILGHERVTTICTDDYHKFDRRQRATLDITPLHPECNYVDVIEQHLELLAAGEPVLKPVYNHSSGTFDPPEYVEPREFVVVEGLLPLFTRRMRAAFDATVYLDPPEDLRRRWKVKRDCAKRGYQPEQVLAELERREPDSAAFIRPQRGHADIAVRFSEPASANGDGSGEHLDVRLVLRPSLTHPDLTTVATDDGSPVRLRLARDAGKPVDYLEIDGCVPDGDARRVEDLLWERMHGPDDLRREAIGAFVDGISVRRSHPLALTQLLIVCHLMAAKARV